MTSFGAWLNGVWPLSTEIDFEKLTAMLKSQLNFSPSCSYENTLYELLYKIISHHFQCWGYLAMAKTGD